MRNSLIAKAFYLAGFIDSWVRGYEKIKNAFEKENLQIPTFEQVRDGVLATLQREKFVVFNKQNNGYVSATDQINNQLLTIYIAQKLGVSYSTIQRVLRVLKQCYLLIFQFQQVFLGGQAAAIAGKRAVAADDTMARHEYAYGVGTVGVGDGTHLTLAV